MTIKPAPLIKEYRLEKLEASLECIDKHAFDRERQKDCILSLYPDKSEKSVFRGMVIPSARHLGLIIGYADLIRLSANGKIMVESKALGNEVHGRVARAVMCEVDRTKFRFMDMLGAHAPVPKDTFLQSAQSVIDAPSGKQANERARHWLSILSRVGLVECAHDDLLTVRQPEYEQALLDLDATLKDPAAFKEHLFDAYSELTRGRAPVSDIADLRQRVALKMLRSDYPSIVTEAQFDEMLRQMPFSTDAYMISLGRPMGPEEKLFEYDRSYFRTLSIRFLYGREVGE